MLPEDPDYTLAFEVQSRPTEPWRYVTVGDSHELALLKAALSISPPGTRWRVRMRHEPTERNAEADGTAWPPADYTAEWLDMLSHWKTHGAVKWAQPAYPWRRFAVALARCPDSPPDSASSTPVPLVAHGKVVGSVAVLPHEDPEDVAERARQTIRRLEAELERATSQRNDIAMGASIKLATARMVLSRLLNSSRLDSYERSALQGVFDMLPAPPSGTIAEADEHARLAWEQRNGGRITR